ncbi:Arc family DNA-binding protein [Membranihabitans maritimus]|uniref:Arc family DNA-binding protein n=1 Tax=Membranihabitans maritimus TaxID=2904244 RepID=UPI001F011F38|nr:Arc family DNA-binding protein [Membranihabitans maritimus]
MAKKRKQIPLRLSEEMQEAVEKWAADEFRSINGQLEWIIYNALKSENRLPKKKPSEETNNNED